MLTDLSSRRAHVNATETHRRRRTRIVASAPEAELGRYVLELRSLTGGQAQLTITPDRYERAPEHRARVARAHGRSHGGGGMTLVRKMDTGRSIRSRPVTTHCLEHLH